MMKNCHQIVAWWCRWLICLGLDVVFFSMSLIWITFVDNWVQNSFLCVLEPAPYIRSLMVITSYKLLWTKFYSRQENFWSIANGLLSLWLNCEFFLTWTSHLMSLMAVSKLYNQQWLLWKNYGSPDEQVYPILILKL